MGPDPAGLNRQRRYLRRVRRLAPWLIGTLLFACSPAEENLAIVANARTALGTGPEQRLLIGLVDPETGASLALPEVGATAELTGPNEETAQLETEFLWTIEGVRGLYLARYRFPSSGAWSVRLLPDGMGPTPPTPFEVAPQAGVPEIGTPAPSVATRTADQFPLAAISSDPNPDPSFYELSLDTALTNGQPTVVVFATPAFCESQTCGPLLDLVKSLAPSYPQVNFLHVEIYENLDAARLEDLRLVPAVASYRLPSEPWVYVMDGEGVIRARFEGVASLTELTTALDSVS